MSLKDNIGIILLLSLFLFSNLSLLDFDDDVGWDSSVYIGMGKYIYSLGDSGLWEPIRPLILPLMLGPIWKMGLDPIIAGRLLIIFFSIFTILLVYLITKKLFSKTTAIIASIITAFSPIMFDMSDRILVEIPAVCFLLLGFYLYLNNRILLSGVLFGLAFLTKFPTALLFIVIIGIGLFNLLRYKGKNTLKNISHITLGFLLVTTPYFLFNYLFYGNPFFPLISAKYVIDNVVGCTILYLKPSSYYLTLLLKNNFLHLFWIVGVYFILVNKENRKNRLIIVLYSVSFFIYFTLLTCKTQRYLMQSLPFIAILASYGIVQSFRKIKNKFNLIIFAILIISVSLTVNHVIKNEQSGSVSELEFYNYLSDKNVDGQILTTTPLITLYTDHKLELIYYPLYGSERIDYYISYIKNNKQRIDYIFIHTADIPCNPADILCKDKTINFLNVLKDNYDLEFHAKSNGDEYFIFSQ